MKFSHTLLALAFFMAATLQGNQAGDNPAPGVRFDHAYAASPACPPTRAALMSGT